MPEIIVIDTRKPQETKTINFAWETGVNREYTIGRDPSCDLVLDDILISRIHGKFSFREGHYYYCDLDSRNSSKINNTVAEPNREYFLKPSDIITLGNHLFWIKTIGVIESAPPPASATPPASAPPPASARPPASAPSALPPTSVVDIFDDKREEFSLRESDLNLPEVSEDFTIPWKPEISEPWEAESPDLDLDIVREKNSQTLTSAPNNSQSANKILYRYPYLECPEYLPINQKFSLYVQILIQSPEPKIEAMAIEDRGKPDKLPELEIVLRARGFDLKGSNTKTIQINRNNDTEERFVLTPRQLGEQQIRVDFYQHDTKNRNNQTQYLYRGNG